MKSRLSSRLRSFELLDRREMLAATVWIADGWSLESNGKLQFSVNLTDPSSSAITVRFATSPGTASSADFTATTGTLTFAPGAVTLLATVPIVDDALVEGTETLQVTLSSPSGATLGDSVATGTILDNDFAATVAGYQVVKPTELSGVIKNPDIGYQTFYTNASGDSQLPSTVMYSRFNWSQIETAPGVYNFSSIDQAISSAQAVGQKLAFRIMPYEEGNAGPVGLKSTLPGFSFNFSGQTTWVPDYNNAAVQQSISRLIAALGARYGNHPAIDSVDVGFVGSWGEWHYSGINNAPPFPTPATLVWMYDQFNASFNVPVIVTYPLDAPDAFAGAIQHGAGWRVDSWGEWVGGDWTHHRDFYPTVVATAGDSWKTAPVIMEPTDTMAGWGNQPWPMTLQWAVDNHVSQFSNKSDAIPAAMLPSVQDLLTKVGYRYVLAQASHATSVPAGNAFNLRLDWLNKGNAPMYQERHVVVKIGNQVIDTGVRMSDLLPGKRTDSLTLPTVGLAPGNYAISVGLALPGSNTPDITLANQGTGPWYGVGNITVTAASGSSVVGRRLFYNQSGSSSPLKFDGDDAAINANDDNAIASDKTAYLAGSGIATFASISSYAKGINGLMIDIAGAHGTLTANDLIFKVGNNNAPDTWTLAPAPTSVAVRAGAGTGGSDRLEVTWANGAIQNTWLQIVVRGNDALGNFNTNTGLAVSDRFFFGSARGDSGEADSLAFSTTAVDAVAARNNPAALASNIPSSNLYDYTRDGKVDASDEIFARNNPSSSQTAAALISIAIAAPAATAAKLEETISAAAPPITETIWTSVNGPAADEVLASWTASETNVSRGRYGRQGSGRSKTDATTVSSNDTSGSLTAPTTTDPAP